MLKLKDGPCEGIFMVRRAPVFLRATKDYSGETDVLDQVEDTPKETEQVFVYEREGEPGSAHICGAKNLRGWYAIGTYHWLIDVNGQELRDNKIWQEWCLKRDSEAKN
ncbi:MAG: hypothetical protein PHG51_06330 [Candidatus Omnitrophica bacterium]|nr:hypothetical protein [Candidatus Omnitrophota bacterium]